MVLSKAAFSAALIAMCGYSLLSKKADTKAVNRNPFALTVVYTRPQNEEQNHITEPDQSPLQVFYGRSAMEQKPIPVFYGRSQYAGQNQVTEPLGLVEGDSCANLLM